MSATKPAPGFLQDYIPVITRISEFYEDYPDGRIVTELIHYDREKPFALVKASVFRQPDDADPAATGHSSDSSKDFTIERAETGAAGRALMMLGYETKRQSKPSAPATRPQAAPKPEHEREQKTQDEGRLALTQEQFSEIGELTERLIKAGVWTDQGDARAFLRQVIQGAKSRHDLNRDEAALFIGELKKKLPTSPTAKPVEVTAGDIPF